MTVRVFAIVKVGALQKTEVAGREKLQIELIRLAQPAQY